MRYSIANGPGKMELATALFVKNGKHPYSVTFELMPEPIGSLTELIAHIHGVGIEDGSRESWNIKGRVTGANGFHFTGYYSTKNRNGYLTVVKESEQ